MTIISPIMNLKRFFLVLIIFFSYDMSCSSSLFNWIDWAIYGNSKSLSSRPGSNQQPDSVSEGVNPISIPFEEMSSEDKFLQEAERFNTISLSALDTCEHKVVMKIQSSCSDMTEEELAKLTISLLNCQSEVSGRSQTTCTDEMSLKECTSPMDSETWNAYHIINNRARAVCYSARQQQFRALSEITVNKLMTSALKQLTTMDELEELQQELNLLTVDAISSLKEGQEDLMMESKGLELAQSKMRNSIASNIKQLTNEKTLIQSVQKQFKTLSEKLVQELDHLGWQLESHGEQHQRVNQEVLANLADIASITDVIWSNIDEKNEKLLEQQDQIQKMTLVTLENLKQINTSVSYLLDLVIQVRAQVDNQMAWAKNTFGADGATLLSLLKHTMYLICGLLLSLFLQLTIVCRVLLLLAVFSNITLVYYHKAVSFPILTAIITGLWAIAVLFPVLKNYKANSMQRNDYHKNDGEEEDKISTHSSSRSEITSHSHNSANIDSPFRIYNDVVSGKDINILPNMKRHNSTSVCAAVCRNGQSCRSAPTPGHKLCKRHIAH